jgi:hypothetical protein
LSSICFSLGLAFGTFPCLLLNFGTLLFPLPARFGGFLFLFLFLGLGRCLGCTPL